MEKHDHHLFLSWLIFTGVVVFGFIVAWNEGFLFQLLESDRSHISIIIGLFFLVGSIHCAHRSLMLARQLEIANHCERSIHNQSDRSVELIDSRVSIGEGELLPAGVVSNYIADVLRSTIKRKSRDEVAESPGTLPEIYASRIKGPHDMGWFIVDLMLKLGLLGTIVGFIMMLGSVASTSTLDITAMQQVLKEMSVGMGTALYTTLAGLTGSVLLGMQYHMLDRSADELLEKTVHLAETEVLPFLSTTP